MDVDIALRLVADKLQENIRNLDDHEPDFAVRYSILKDVAEAIEEIANEAYDDWRCFKETPERKRGIK